MTATAAASTAEEVAAATQALRESLQITSLEDDADFMKGLVYADPGGGKTHFLGTAADHPALFPVLIFDVEGGLATLKKFPNKQNIERIKIRSLKELDDRFNKLVKSIGAGTFPFKTVGVDSLSELTDVDMRDIMRAAYERNPDKVDIDVPSQREWGIARSHVRKIVRAFRDLPCHVIMTAQVGSRQEEGQPTKFFPGFAGKLRTEVPGFFDFVGYMYNESSGGDITRKIQFTGTRRVVAKDRYGKFGDQLEDPTLSKMWELMQGEYGES